MEEDFQVCRYRNHHKRRLNFEKQERNAPVFFTFTDIYVRKQWGDAVMEFQKVKAVEMTGASRGKSKKTKKERDAQWSVRFLELLVQEFEEEEKEKQNSGNKKEHHAKAPETSEDEYDCRIVVKGEETVPLDWDSFEVTRDFTEPVLTSELYEDIIDSVKLVGNWQAGILYKIANAIMQDYYKKALGERAVGELFTGCYQKCTEKNKQITVSKERCREILEILYEYFSRVNARKSVAANEREGRALVEKSGLLWAGTTYYNSVYYYECMKMQCLFRKKCREIIKKYGLEEIAFEKIEQDTQFKHAGGLTFHSMFVWVQQKDNHPSNQYGMRDLQRVPPRNFVYLYRNHCAGSERMGVSVLEHKTKSICQEQEKKQFWRSFILEDGRDYHNGMSYLLEGSLMDEEDETLYSEAMHFLQNFILFRREGCVEYLLLCKE